MSSAPSAYQLQQRSWDKEDQRLHALARWADPQTTELLARIGVSAGWRCLEVGAGSGSIARWLAERVGPAGHVLAVDLETGLLAADPRPNLRVRQLDVCTDELPSGEFDLIHCRSVLAHLADPTETVRRLIAALAPGGWLVVGAADLCWAQLPSWPAHPATAQPLVTAVMRAVVELVGPWHRSMLGRDLVEFLYDHHLAEVGAEARAPLADRHGSEWMRLSVERLHDQLISTGRVSQADLADFHAVLADPAAWMAAPLYVYAWGRAPERDPALAP